MDLVLDLFAAGPPVGIERALRLRGPRGEKVVRRAAVIAGISWLAPFTILAVKAGIGEPDPLRSFLSDFAVQARSLVAAPMLVLAEALCAPRLGAIACHFVRAGLVPDAERARFHRAMNSTARLLDLRVAEIGVACLAYAFIFLMLGARPSIPAWQLPANGGWSYFSLAGWWHVLVSAPLLLILVFGWLFRVALWTRFLWLVARLDLRLIPAHPDLVAGLRFVGHSLRAFAVVGFAFGAIVAGTLANRVVHGGASLLVCKDAAVGLAIFVVVVFGAPLLVFSHNLVLVWRDGIFRYGALADRLGREFETKWLAQPDAPPTLDTSEFSAAIDLYSVVSNVYQMKLVPVDYGSLISLVIATLAPLAPVLLLRIPLEVVFATLAKLAF
jgi:hypothetical protein